MPRKENNDKEFISRLHRYISVLKILHRARPTASLNGQMITKALLSMMKKRLLWKYLRRNSIWGDLIASSEKYL